MVHPPPEQCLAHLEHRRTIPASRQAARDAFIAMQHNAQGFTMADWYVWYLSLEIGEDLFNQHYQWIKAPRAALVEAVCDVPDSYPFDPDNGIVQAITPEMLKNPQYQPTATTPPRPSEPAYSPFWTTPGCTDIPDYAIINPKDGIVAGLVAERPGKLWKYMTGHLKNLRSPISKSYLENIEYVKVPAFRTSIMIPRQLQHALASVSEKWINRDWSATDPRDFPPELNQDFETSLLNPSDRIPDGAASAIAVISYVTRVLQIMICESSMFKDNMMWDPQFNSWRLMFATVPQSKDTPPTYYHVTWKKDQYGKWKTLSSPPHTALMKDLRLRNPMTETMHIQLHGSDFAKLPLSGGIKWLIEFPPEWSWFLSWAPGAVPEHLKDHSSWASRSRASASGSAPASSSASASMTSLTTPGSSSVFQMPSQVSDLSLGTTCKAPSVASASPAAVPQPTFDNLPQCPAPPVPQQPTAYAPPPSKMTSSAPPCIAASPCSVPVLVPASLPQPPIPSWQTRCTQQPVPLDEFLAQDVEQNEEPDEHSTLVQAVAHNMDTAQQAKHIRDRTWQGQEVEKRNIAQQASSLCSCKRCTSALSVQTPGFCFVEIQPSRTAQ